MNDPRDQTGYCSATTKDGTLCRAFRAGRSPYCASHNPDRYPDLPRTPAARYIAALERKATTTTTRLHAINQQLAEARGDEFF